VSGPEFTYDSTFNEETEDSIYRDDSSNQSPVADAGSDQTIPLGDFVALDGSKSYDPDGTILSYVWSFENGETIDGVSATHMYNSVGNHRVTLMVTDDNGALGSNNTVITVTD
jgi:chitodextrinase